MEFESNEHNANFSNIMNEEYHICNKNNIAHENIKLKCIMSQKLHYLNSVVTETSCSSRATDVRNLCLWKNKCVRVKLQRMKSSSSSGLWWLEGRNCSLHFQGSWCSYRKNPKLGSEKICGFYSLAFSAEFLENVAVGSFFLQTFEVQKITAATRWPEHSAMHWW